MILDTLTTYADDAAASALAAGRNVSPFTLQHRRQGRHFAKPTWVEIILKSAIIGVTSVDFQLETAAAIDGSDELDTPVVLASTGAIAVADLVAGAKFRIPVTGLLLDKFTALNLQTVGTSSAGSYSAHFTDNVQENTPSEFSRDGVTA